jgi:hypothetical protein
MYTIPVLSLFFFFINTLVLSYLRNTYTHPIRTRGLNWLTLYNKIQPLLSHRLFKSRDMKRNRGEVSKKYI